MGSGQRIDKTGRTVKRPKFALINHDTMDSPAWKSLGAVERATLLMIYNRHDGSNNGKIALSVREVAIELSIGKSTAAKAFDELQRCGFIRAAIKSSFDWKVESGEFEGRSTRWRLTEEPTGPKEKRISATRDFVSWRSPKDDYDEHIRLRERVREAKKMQNAVRPQVRGVPDGGQSVPDGGQKPSKDPLSVPVGGQTAQIAQIGVPQDGQYISTIHSTSKAAVSGGSVDLPSQEKRSSPQPQSPKAKSSVIRIPNPGQAKRIASTSHRRPS